MLPFGLGIGEIIVVLAIALVIFGPKKLPELGKNLGKGLKGLKSGLEDASEEFKAEIKDSPENDSSTNETKKQ